MTIDFRRELDGSYMILSREENVDLLSARMVEEAKPEHLLALKLRQNEGGCELSYDIGGMKNLESSCATREMEAEEIRELMSSIYRILGETEEYLLDPNALWLEPGMIYRGKNGWNFCLDPGRKSDFYEQIQGLSRYILRKCSHDDEETKQLGYELFRVCHEDNFSFAQIFEVLDRGKKEREPGREAPGTETEGAAPKKGFFKRFFFPA